MEENDFEFLDGAQPQFYRSNGDISNCIEIYLSDRGLSGNSLFSISHHLVEEVILRVGLPNLDLTSFQADRDRLYTLYDHTYNYPYSRGAMKIGTKDDRKFIESLADVVEWSSMFLKYVKESGLNFVHSYSYLPNVLSELDRLQTDEKLNYNQLLTGMGDQWFRALIISKLCADPGFEEKCSRVDEKILGKLPDWEPYYLKLKFELAAIGPQFNYL